ncbi:MAG: PIN domain-containing protein [bacterium]|nr:PIN domain-containing protein [bacterium]
MSPDHLLSVDTSVAVPLLIASHEAHDRVLAWAAGLSLTLCGHAVVETYSVLTRLPGGARVAAEDAIRLIDANFERRLALPQAEAEHCHRVLAKSGVEGGATYDGLVALAAIHHGATLATRDARARTTYEAIGVPVVLVN